MYLKVHLLLSALFCALFYTVFGNDVWLIFVGGIIVDFDHYIAYVWKSGKMDPVKCYHFYMKSYGNESYLFVFHLLEFYLAVFIVGIFYRPVFFLFVGMLSHLILDIAGESNYRKNWKRKFSYIYRLAVR